jgi:fatty acid desaturase
VSKNQKMSIGDWLGALAALVLVTLITLGFVWLGTSSSPVAIIGSWIVFLLLTLMGYGFNSIARRPSIDRMSRDREENAATKK